MKKVVLLFFIFFVLVINICFVEGVSESVVEWQKALRGGSLCSVQQTSDGGYIILNSVFNLIKTDSEGNELWSKYFPGWDARLRCGDSGVRQTSDGGYVLTGLTLVLQNSWDVYFVKTDSEGNQAWAKTFGGSSNEGSRAVQQTSDGGYIITGYGSGTCTNCKNLYIIKTNSRGVKIWDKKFGGAYFEEGYSVQQTSDGGYIIVGDKFTSNHPLSTRIYIIKVDSEGNLEWENTQGAFGRGRSVQQTSEGGYVVAGKKSSYGYLIKMDPEGNELWSKNFDRGQMLSVRQTNDEGYIIAGENSEAGNSDAYLVKTDSNGNELWSKTFGGVSDDYGYFVEETSDGGYVFLATLNGHNYLIKLSSDFIPLNYVITPSFLYSLSKQFEVGAYIYDNENGEDVQEGFGSYWVKKDGEYVDSGELIYEGLWKASKNLDLVSGRYDVEINVNGFIEEFSFYVGSSVARVYGDVSEVAEVKIYDSLNVGVVLDSVNGGNYSFDVEPGSYIVEAVKDDLVYTTIAFSVLGGQEIRKDLMLSSRGDSLKNLLRGLKEDFIFNLDKETGMMAELTGFASVDLIDEDAKAVRDIFVSGVVEGEIDWTEVLQNIVVNFFQRKNYEEALDSLIGNIDEGFNSLENSDEAVETFYWLMNESGEVNVRTKEELQSTVIYGEGLDNLDDIYEESSFSVNEDFDFQKARKVMGEQANQLDGLWSGGVLLLPDSVEPVIWSFDDYHNSYLVSKKGMETAGILKKVSFSFQVGAGVLAGIFTTPAGGVATFFAMEKALTPVNLFLNFAKISNQVAASQSYGLASSEWIVDIFKTSDVYGEVINYFEQEAESPYYLNKNNFFDSEIEIELNVDRVANGKNFIYPGYEMFVSKKADVVVRNTGDAGLNRVLIESKWEHVYLKKKVTDFLGYDYFYDWMEEGEEIFNEIDYYGTNQANIVSGNAIFEPHVMIAQGFVGPFQNAIEKEYYFVLPIAHVDRVAYSPYLSEGEDVVSWQEDELFMRSEDKKFTINDFIEYTSDIVDIGSESDGIGLESVEGIDLSLENPEFVFNYSVKDSYGVEFQMFSGLGSDVDLEVYYNGARIGFDSSTGEDEIGFPGTYSGKNENPEIIYVPNAGNKTYEVKVKLVKADSNLSVPIDVSVLEEPFRPAILMVSPFEVNETVFAEENFTIDFQVGEAGGQEPLYDVSVDLILEGVEIVSGSFDIDKIDAGDFENLVFELVGHEAGIFEGQIVVNSSAGELVVEVVVEVIELVNAGEDFYVYESYFSNYVVELEGSGFGENYLWEQVSGVPVVLRNAESAVAEFNAPKDIENNEEANLSFRLTVGEYSEDVEVYVRIPGDATGDNLVNSFDLAKFRQKDLSADFTGEGKVNAFDWAIMRRNFGRKRV